MTVSDILTLREVSSEGALLSDFHARDMLLASMRKLTSDSALQARLSRVPSADAQLFSCDHAGAESWLRLVEAT